MGRSPCCSKEGMNRGAWTAIEDKILVAYIKAHGEGQWRNLPKRAGLKRCGKSCRLRWLNYLRPDIKRGNISLDEEDLIIRLHNLLGNRWSLIAGRLPGRTDNEIKNYWNTTLGKKTNAQSKIATTPSPNPSPCSLENSTTRKLASEPSNSPQPTQVIRTRATRCTKVIIPFENQTGIANYYPTATEPPQNSPNYLNNLESCQDHHQLFERREMENYMAVGPHQNQSLVPSDQEEAPMINDWITSFSTIEDNDILDLDSLASLLESEEWP